MYIIGVGAGGESGGELFIVYEKEDYGTIMVSPVTENQPYLQRACESRTQ